MTKIPSYKIIKNQTKLFFKDAINNIEKYSFANYQVLKPIDLSNTSQTLISKILSERKTDPDNYCDTLKLTSTKNHFGINSTLKSLDNTRKDTGINTNISVTLKYNYNNKTNDFQDKWQFVDFESKINITNSLESVCHEQEGFNLNIKNAIVIEPKKNNYYNPSEYNSSNFDIKAQTFNSKYCTDSVVQNNSSILSKSFDSFNNNKPRKDIDINTNSSITFDYNNNRTNDFKDKWQFVDFESKINITNSLESVCHEQEGFNLNIKNAIVIEPKKNNYYNPSEYNSSNFDIKAQTFNSKYCTDSVVQNNSSILSKSFDTFSNEKQLIDAQNSNEDSNDISLQYTRTDAVGDNINYENLVNELTKNARYQILPSCDYNILFDKSSTFGHSAIHMDICESIDESIFCSKEHNSFLLSFGVIEMQSFVCDDTNSLLETSFIGHNHSFQQD